MKTKIKNIKDWYRIKIKHRVTVLDVLKRAYVCRQGGLCHSFQSACYHYNVGYAYFKAMCYRFNRADASCFGANQDPLGAWWWPKGEWGTGRRLYLEALIKYYSAIDPIYLS